MRTITTCRSCDGEQLHKFLDLGEQKLSDFREDKAPTKANPLVACICLDCKLVQLLDTTESGDMYHENYGFKSGISNSIKDDLKEIVGVALKARPEAMSWLDIASNDGTLLSYVPDSIYTTGIDPIGFLCEEASNHADMIINDFFSSDFFNRPNTKDSEPEYLQFDVITSISCFYDMDDPNKFVSEVTDVLAPEGVWVIQQNYLLPTMELNAVDNFCHEHLEYYTLLSLEPLLERHGLEVIDLSTNMVNGGSIRTVVAHKGDYPVQDSVEQQRAIELDAKLDTLEPYERFATDVFSNLDELHKLVVDLSLEGKEIAILAASTRGSTIWQSANIEEYVEYAVERNPAKVGKYFSSVGIPIISEEDARERNPDYMIIGPWFFADEIIKREKEYVMSGGKLILPLPKLEIIDAGYFSTDV